MNDITSSCFLQVRLSRKWTKLQKDIQERQRKINNMKHCEIPKGEEEPAEDRARTESHMRQLEEEIEKLKRKTAHLEELLCTNDSLQFLQLSPNWEKQ